jgi:hypothetical protein
MDNTTSQGMPQSSLNLLTILQAQAPLDGEDVMVGMMAFDQDLTAAIQVIKQELRSSRSTAAIFDAMNAPMASAAIFGADDLVGVTQRAYPNFPDDENARLDNISAADTLVWLAIAEQTRSALRVLFHACLIFGRAPNGKPLSTAAG